jgi:hypothetical protein
MITGRAKPKYFEKNLLRCSFMHFKFNVECPK